ncbi:MAG: type II secretion system protein [Planctomycetota bacterium]
MAAEDRHRLAQVIGRSVPPSVRHDRLAASRGARRRARRGFTLIELIVVITIMVILASILTTAIMLAMRTAKENECQVKIQTLSAQLEEYQRRCGSYPPCDQEDAVESSKELYKDLTQPPKGVRFEFHEEDFNCLDTDQSGEKAICDPWNRAIWYAPAKMYQYQPPNKDSFRLMSAGPDGSFDQDDSDNIFNWTYSDDESSPYHLRQMNSIH